MENQITEHGKKRKRSVKPFFNVRAHSNPLSDNHFEGTPIKPSDFDWKRFYPEFFEKHPDSTPRVEIADIGCGFGGLLCNKIQNSTFTNTHHLSLLIK